MKLIIAGLAAVLCLGAQTVGENPFAGDQDAIRAGEGTFRIYCSPCHGIRAAGGRGPDLTLGSFTAGDRDEDLYRVIVEGIPGTEMADFGARLGPENVWRVVAYIRSLSRRAPPAISGDRARGEKIFWGKGACGSCHRIGRKGSRLGPDLTLVGRQRSFDYISESLIEPDAELTPGFNRITVVLGDGRRIEGVERNYDGFSVQFMDASENLHSYLHDEVASVQREFRSLMPSYRQSLSEQERNDLLLYLLSLRGTE